jgi:hypothetical protein
VLWSNFAKNWQYFEHFFQIFIFFSAIPFPIGFCYRQVAILLRLLGITVIISPHHHKSTWA